MVFILYSEMARRKSARHYVLISICGMALDMLNVGLRTVKLSLRLCLYSTTMHSISNTITIWPITWKTFISYPFPSCKLKTARDRKHRTCYKNVIKFEMKHGTPSKPSALLCLCGFYQIYAPRLDQGQVSDQYQ